MNIDKDINYLKRQIETSERQFEEIGVGCLSSKEIEAISNVISELDETKATLKCTQDSWYKDTQELETWKKIAEKLAERFAKTSDYSYEGNNFYYCGAIEDTCKISEVSIPNEVCKQCIIDWAKREVEKNENL